MFLKSLQLDTDPSRIHTVRRTTGKDPVTNHDRIETLTLETDTNHFSVSDQSDIDLCFDQLEVLKDSPRPSAKS